MFPDTIVVPLDGSEFAARALPVARALVRQTGSRMLLMSTRWDGDITSARSYLEDVAAVHQDVDASTIVIGDRPAASAIQLVASESPGRMICMTTHGRGRVRWALLGSVAEEVVRESAVPVLLLGRHCRADWPDSFHKLVLCVDGTSSTPAVETVAGDWAKTLGLEVHVVTVIHPFDASEPDEVQDAIGARLEEQGLHTHKCVLRSTYPAAAIADFAEGVEADVIAMSSHARIGTARVALGSVTMGVVGMARCPVLVNKTA